jgi:phage repressor protein C with HTH and peptisase S24 domain
MATGRDFKKSLKVNDLTHEMAAEKLNISRGTLNKYFKEGELDEDFVQNVQSLLGINLNEPVIPYTLQRRDQKLNDEPYLVPYVDIPAQAGYTKAYQQRDYIATLRKYPILPDVDPTGLTWRYFQIEGDSMEPEIMAGDVILCSQVNKEDWQSVKNYHTHVIVTEEDLWIKDVFRDKPTEWILLSQNETVSPLSVKVEDIKQVWVMRRHVKSRVKKSRMYDIDNIRKQLKK